jgi:hypothetical protein
MFNADLAMRNEGGLFKVRFLLLAPFVLIMVKSILDSHQFLSHPKNIPSPGKFWPIQNHVPIDKKQIPPPHTTQQQLHTVRLPNATISPAGLVMGSKSVGA